MSTFERIPSNGETLFILGQGDQVEMSNYVDYAEKARLSPLPCGFAFYTSLSGDREPSKERWHILHLVLLLLFVHP